MPSDWILHSDMKAVELPEHARAAFSEVTAKIKGATYLPLLLCATREVAEGRNFMFYCRQTLATFDPDGHIIQMVVHKPNNGEAVVVGIKRLL